MQEITLTKAELYLAAMIGVMRHISSIVNGRQDQHGFDGSDGDGWKNHIEGACGEFATAKAKNWLWNGSINTFHNAGDVGKVEVRTRTKHHYELIVRSNDNDAVPFVLVTGIAPTYRVHGWIYGREAKREEWSQNHGGRPPAYFVPQNELEPIDTLTQGTA